MRQIRRAVHFDFHTMPGIHDFNRDFDAAVFAQRLADAHVDYINFFAHCNLGFAYYPTKLGIPYPLAGVEALPDAEPPAGWTKWVSPAYEYVAAPQNGPDAFPRALNYLAENGFSLAGAAYDLTIPGSGSFIYLPIRKI